MGRMLNPKKKKMPSRKQHKELQEQGVDVDCERSNPSAEPFAIHKLMVDSVQGENPCGEIGLVKSYSYTKPILYKTAQNYQELAFGDEFNRLLEKYSKYHESSTVSVTNETIEKSSETIDFPGWLSDAVESVKGKLKEINDTQNESSPGKCSDLWGDGDW